MILYWKIISRRKVRKGASCRITLSTMPQTSMPQQQFWQQSVCLQNKDSHDHLHFNNKMIKYTHSSL